MNILLAVMVFWVAELAAINFARAADGQVKIKASYIISLDRVEPKPTRGIITKNVLNVVLSNGKEITEEWNEIAGVVSRQRSSTRILGNPSSVEWRVLSSNKLRRISDNVQSTMEMVITVDKEKCYLKVDFRLKKGFKEFAFNRISTNTIGYFTNLKLISTDCVIQ